jgi:hypothetical protein
MQTGKAGFCPAPSPSIVVASQNEKERASDVNFGELAWGFVETFEELDTEELNELLKKNVPLDALVFFEEYADLVRSEEPGLKAHDAGRLPEIMLMGYLIHALEERLQPKVLPPA